MKPIFMLMSATVLAASLSGCQSVAQDLQQVNQGLSVLTGQKVAKTNPAKKRSKTISNQWHVSDREAMAWLTHDNILWDNHGKTKGVNWYTFWSQQIHAKTALADKAHQYCHENSWDSRKTGGNCQTYFQADSTTNAEESQSWGNKLIQTVSD